MAVELSLSRIGYDFIILLIVSLPMLIFQFFVTPFKRGFYCNDESIRYPLINSTVSTLMISILGAFVPSILIFCTEYMRAVYWEKKCNLNFNSYRCRQYNIHRLLIRLYIFLGYYFIGISLNQLMVNVAKYTIGRLRPNFIEACKPNVDINDCKSNYKYIDKYECLEKDTKLVTESFLSFYSGHSALAFYAVWYTSLYLQARLYKPLFHHLILPIIQFLLFSGAFFISYTRVSNYKHHWSDVLVGILFGSIIGIINAVCIAEVFDKREIPSDFTKKKILNEIQYVLPTDQCLFSTDNVNLNTTSNPGPTHVVVNQAPRFPSIINT